MPGQSLQNLLLILTHIIDIILPLYLEDFTKCALSNLGHLFILVNSGTELEVKLFKVPVNVRSLGGVATS